MAPSRFPAVLLAATLAATSSAIEFGSENDVTQTAGTVAPRGEMPTSTAATGVTGFANVESPTQWSASSSNAPTTALVVASSGSGGWTQPTTTDTPAVWSTGSGQSSGHGWTPPTSTDSPSMWTSGQSSGSGNTGWSQPSTDFPSMSTPSSGQGSGTGEQGWTSTASSAAWTPSSGDSRGYDDEALGVDCSGSSEGGWSLEMSLECSGSDEEVNPNNDFSLECSGSDEEEPSVSTSTAGSSNFTPTMTTAPTTSSSSSNTATSATSSVDENTTPTESSSSTPTSIPSSETSDQGTSSMASSSDTAQSTASSSNIASSATQGGSDATQGGSSTAQGGSDATQTSTNSGEHASFGEVTSKSGECVVGNPDKYISTADVDWVYEHRMGENQTGNQNWLFDHIVANKGSLNYCVRWDSTEKLSKTIASKFQAMLERQYAAWNRWLIGYGCWPYNEIKINMVGFAVKEASLLDWTDDSLGTIYAGELGAEGVPQCPQTCYRFFDNGPKTWSDTSACKGEPFDLSLWPKQGLEGGFGSDWGQEINLENMLQTIDDEQLVIVAHEIGHGFGLPDFYEEADKPNKDFPPAIMMAGSSRSVTDSDGWMLRRAYENIRSRYSFK